MCGILFRSASGRWNQEFQELQKWIQRRGPDSDSLVDLDGMQFYSSVLSLRIPFTPQPIIRDNHVLQFNGELYNDNFAENDTQHFFDSIQNVGVLQTLRAFHGEYAFVYYDSEAVWFARDCIGRRSLLYCVEEGELFVSSVGLMDHSNFKSAGLKEVPGGSVFQFQRDSGHLVEYQWGKDIEYPYGQVSASIGGKTDKFEGTSTSASASIESNTDKFEAALVQAVQRRVPVEDHLAILFSGGLDCTLLASITDQLLPAGTKVDLLNVAFENPRTGGGFDTPDRKLGIQSFQELSSGSDRFRFVEINVPFAETVEHRPTVQQLMHPKDSVMDLSIAIAFYFASRGQGTQSYSSKSKVLISGLGADELFGGYSRHSKQLSTHGYESLCEELQMDFSRLHERNLGRDDRVCTTWGKEVRYPFLDEDVVQLAMDIPLDQKVSVDETKILLRRIAEARGLKLVAQEKKRAIQFGAKSAKMEVGQGRVKGHEKLTL